MCMLWREILMMWGVSRDWLLYIEVLLKVASYPDQKVVSVGNFKIGLIHGHQVVPWGDIESLSLFQRQLDVDILISGHTHKVSHHPALSRFNRFNSLKLKCTRKSFISTQALQQEHIMLLTSECHVFMKCSYLFDSNVIPSFALMDIQGDNLVAYVYQLQKEVKVQKVEYKK